MTKFKEFYNEFNKIYLLIFIFLTIGLISAGVMHSKIFLEFNKLTAEAVFRNDTQFLRQVYNVSLKYPFYSEDDNNHLIVLKEEIKIEDKAIGNYLPSISINTDLLPNELTVNIQSQIGSAQVVTSSIVKDSESRIINEELEFQAYPMMEVSLNGTGENEVLISNLESQFKEIIAENFEDKVTLRKLKVLPVSSIEASHTNEVINFGLAEILYPACNYYIQIPFGLHWKTQTYYLSEIGNITEFMCDPEVDDVYPETVRLATCDNCTLFRIDKTTFLPSNYAPKTVTLENFVGGGEIAEQSFKDLEEFYLASKAAGFKTNITSSYRSYSTQQSVFKYWVDREKDIFGRNQEEAEASANTYSARPGFSEHQLGTTIDMNSEECNGFDGFCQANEDIWSWLEANSWNYGFIRSYPDNRQEDTGYVGEDWHYRWLGRDIAKEYIETSNGKTLNIWLEDRYLQSFSNQR